MAFTLLKCVCRSVLMANAKNLVAQITQLTVCSREYASIVMGTNVVCKRDLPDCEDRDSIV